MAATSVLEKVKKLMTLAADDATAEEEARTAALQLVRLMRENELVPVPKSDFEKVQASVEGMQRQLNQAKAEANNKMFIGAALGALAAKFVKL